MTIASSSHWIAFLQLFLFITIGVVPFLNHRVLRMAGDEKVYVAQAIEMARSNFWFIQRLADEPNYFKGPFHYLAVRFGLLCFGNQLVAGLWINALLTTMTALLLYFALWKRRVTPSISLIIAAGSVLNFGILSHLYASQMEVELTAFYTFALAGLLLDSPWIFWVSAGLAGWVKSPLHSLLIGCGGFLVWSVERRLLDVLKHKSFWIAWGCGVLACILGYLPQLIFDRENFIRLFLLREQFEKGSNARSWTYVTFPLLYFLFPWTFAAGYGIIRHFKEKRSSPVLRTGLLYSIPTLLFWCFWNYKGQNYNLPVIPALMVAGLAGFSNWSEIRKPIRFTGGISFLAVGALAAVILYFGTSALGIPIEHAIPYFLFALLCLLGFAVLFFNGKSAPTIMAGAACLALGFGSLISPLGEHELTDLRAFQRRFPNATLHYYNLEPTIWSEWGLLQLASHTNIFGLHRENQLADALRPGHAILLPGEGPLKKILEISRRNRTQQAAPSVTLWRRWLTKGRGPDGQPRWLDALKTRDLTKLERNYFILSIPDKK